MQKANKQSNKNMAYINIFICSCRIILSVTKALQEEIQLLMENIYCVKYPWNCTFLASEDI